MMHKIIDETVDQDADAIEAFGKAKSGDVRTRNEAKKACFEAAVEHAKESMLIDEDHAKCDIRLETMVNNVISGNHPMHQNTKCSNMLDSKAALAIKLTGYCVSKYSSSDLSDHKAISAEISPYFVEAGLLGESGVFSSGDAGEAAAE